MTCRHNPGDPTCTSGNSAEALAQKGREMLERWDPQPDNTQYEVLEAQPMDGHLIMKVRYASCPNCAFEGTKIMVFLNTSAVDALKWKRIDPHFQDPMMKGMPADAPTPDARFPATEQGWSHAIKYAQSLNEKSCA